jgi:hypothetical protein
VPCAPTLRAYAALPIVVFTGVAAADPRPLPVRDVNRLHLNEERLGRRLLMSYDRVGTDEFEITHELLGQILRSRRATVRLSAESLPAAGRINHHRAREAPSLIATGSRQSRVSATRQSQTKLDGVVQRAQRSRP